MTGARDDEAASPAAAAGDPRGGQVVRFKLLTPGARRPQRAYEGDAAYDLFAVAEQVLAPLTRAVVGTGVALELPPGLCALTVPRSGLAARNGISIVNAPGLIDPGYRGELRVILLNTDAHEPFVVHSGDRIAQLLFAALAPVRLLPVDELAASHRGERGFGSSGGFGERDRRG
jgi:dUTP pyrophosphatase